MADGHVIVIEDDDLMRDLIAQYLKRAEIPHEMCDSAERARERLRDNHIALALVDVGLPGEGGLELAAWIRARHPLVGVALVTGDDKAIARELSFDGIEKRFTGRELVDKVREWLARAQAAGRLAKLERKMAAQRFIIGAAAASAVLVNEIIKWTSAAGH